MDFAFAAGVSDSAISDMQAYMDMLNPDISSDEHKNNSTPSASDAVSNPPPPPTYPPPPPPPGSLPTPPPPPSYPAPQPPMEPSSAEFLKVKSNLRHVESSDKKKKVRKKQPVVTNNVRTKCKSLIWTFGEFRFKNESFVKQVRS